MKIALTHADLPNESKGGVAFQVHYLANALVDRGHDVTLFTFSPAWPECRYQVHSFPKPPAPLKRLYSFALAARLARTDFGGFDVLHTNGDNFLLKRNGPCPQVRTFYGAARDEADHAARLRRRLYQRLMAYLETRGARTADIVVGISEATRARIPAVTRVVPCGVDVGRFHPGPKFERPAVLFVGTAGGRKRGDFLADVFARSVRPRFPDAELWAVADRPLAGENVVNFGKVPFETLADLYRRAWVFCLPSTYEGFGVPYIEAMASGTAVVASPNPGAREVLENGRWGVLASDATLGDDLYRLLNDAGERAHFAAQSLGRSRDFAWTRVAEQYERIYADAVERFGCRRAGTAAPSQALERAK